MVDLRGSNDPNTYQVRDLFEGLVGLGIDFCCLVEEALLEAMVSLPES